MAAMGNLYDALIERGQNDAITGRRPVRTDTMAVFSAIGKGVTVPGALDVYMAGFRSVSGHQSDSALAKVRKAAAVLSKVSIWD